MSEKHFTITITYEHTLSVGDIWPDDDAPANPTAADVEALIEESGGPEQVLGDWSLDEDPVLTVREAAI